MQIAKKEIGESSIKFTWADETVTEVAMAGFSPEIVERAAKHGISQKLGDSYSGAAGDVQAAKAALMETLDALREGDWNRKGGGISSGGIWVEALARAADDTIEKALEAWNTMGDAERSAMRKDSRVKLAKAEIEVERAKAKAEEAAPFTLPSK